MSSNETDDLPKPTKVDLSGVPETMPWPLWNRAMETRRSDGMVADPMAVDLVDRIDDDVAGLIGVMDPIKASTSEAVRTLTREGLTIVMATGDNRQTAKAIGRRLGLHRVHAEMLPEQKRDVVTHWRAAGCVVAMAGDGINDALALTEADVGIAMGTGTDVAIDSAGMTLVKGDLRGVVRARNLSKATMTNVRQNLFFAFFYNALGVPVAAGVLYPFFGLLLSPLIAALAMTFSDVSVVTNALRLRNVKL